MLRVMIIALLALAAFPAYAGQQLWQRLQYGMTAAQVSQLEPRAVPNPRVGSGQSKDCQATLVIPSYSIGEIDLDVAFVFCREHLARVVLSAKPLSNQAAVERTLELLERALRDKYGAPAAQDDVVHEDTEFYSQKRRWLHEGTDIHLLRLTAAGRWSDSWISVVYSCETKCLAEGL